MKNEMTEDRIWALRELLKNADLGYCGTLDGSPTWYVADIIKAMLGELK